MNERLSEFALLEKGFVRCFLVERVDGRDELEFHFVVLEGELVESEEYELDLGLADGVAEGVEKVLFLKEVEAGDVLY